MSGSNIEGLLPSSRRWPLFVAGLVIGAGAFAAASAFLASDDEVAATEEIVVLSTAEVETADLLEEIEWAGTLDFTGRTTVNRTEGVVTAVVEAGTTISRGDTLVEIDGEPVVLFVGTTPLYRTMAQDVEGPDVFELESNLVELGFDPDGTVTVDEDYTYNTSLMVERWQEAIGAEITGEVEAAAAAVVSSEMVLLSSSEVGTSGNVVLDLAPPSDLVVTVAVAVADADDWELGDEATVELADESTFEAAVVEIGTEITTDVDGSTLDISLEPIDDTSGLFGGDVTVVTIGEEIRGATVVPTRALVALAEGGFAVEIDGGTGASTLVAVEIGSFDDGIVEIVSGDIAAGDFVVVPQ